MHRTIVTFQDTRLVGSMRCSQRYSAEAKHRHCSHCSQCCATRAPLPTTAKHALHATPGIAPGDGDADRHRYQRRDSHVVHPPSFWSPPEPPPPSHEKLKKLLAKSPRPLPPAWLRIATTNCKAGARQKEARQKKNRRPTASDETRGWKEMRSRRHRSLAGGDEGHSAGATASNAGDSFECHHSPRGNRSHPSHPGPHRS